MGCIESLCKAIDRYCADEFELPDTSDNSYKYKRISNDRSLNRSLEDIELLVKKVK